MKKIRILQLCMLLGVLGIAVFSAFGIDLTSLLIVGGVGIKAMAATGVIVDETATTSTTEEGSPDLLDFDYDKLIVKELPSRSPLDTIFRTRAGKRKSESLKVPYFTVDTKPFQDTVTSAVTVGDALSISLPVADIKMWSVHDTLKFQGVNGYDGTSDNNVLSFNNLVARVLSKDTSAKTLTIQPLNGYYSDGDIVFHDDISSGTIVTRMGKAEPELAMQTAPYSILPYTDFNYCQNFMAQIEESEWQNLHKKRVQWDFNDYSRLNIADMRATKELSFLWGTRSKHQDLNTNEDVYTCGGLSQYITKNKTHGSSISNTDFISWRTELFEDNNGSEERHAFIGIDLWEKLQAIEDIQRQIAANKTERIFGVNFAKIEFGNEVIWLHKHRLMSEAGWGDYGIVLDLQHVSERAFVPLREDEIDLQKSGQKNAKAKVLREVVCPILKYPDTHMIISPA